MDSNQEYIRINIAEGELEIRGDENFIRLYSEQISKVINMLDPKNIRNCCADNKTDSKK